VLADGGKLEEARQNIRNLCGAMKPELRDGFKDFLAGFLIKRKVVTSAHIDYVMDQKMAGDKRFPDFQRVIREMQTKNAQGQ
jgi:hypothetical protein